jgi:ribonucleoside-triphosphate reductase (formate)
MPTNKEEIAISLVDSYVSKGDWRIKENSNMAYSLQGLNNHICNDIIKEYWLGKVYPEEIGKLHRDGDFHIHDLGSLSVYCVGHSLEDLIRLGFCGVESKTTSSPAKHFRTALGQVVNFMYTLQGEAAGAQAFSNFDTLLAPFIRKDGLTRKEVKQAMQEFVFNMNVPTRVGFQCMSEDTEILTAEGWKGHSEVRVGEEIATFNVAKTAIEYLPVKKVFSREYKGKMFRLKNRITDQLISPKHRIVRKVFNTSRYELMEIEKAMLFKSPLIVPVGSKGRDDRDGDVSVAWAKMLAWVISEGTFDCSGRGTGRITVYQSKTKSAEKYEEIKSLSAELGLVFSERSQNGLGDPVQCLRYDSESTRKILSFFSDGNGIKFVPGAVLSSGVAVSRAFIDTYMKGDGFGSVITTTSPEIKEGLFTVAANAGYCLTERTSNPTGISKKLQYHLRLVTHPDTCVTDISEVDYQGVIWCPNTANETVVARRKGKIFITGNTVFSNLSLDLTVPKHFASQPVVIGGQIQEEKYGDFQEEMDLLNDVFMEVMSEGDANGRVFSFPIPTYSITKDFDWDNPRLDRLWEATAKYGIPYFANFVNSDMDPEDSRSMCCRIKIDLLELRKRGGGLFGANPLTGSIGVVTVNLPRLGVTSSGKDEFIEKLLALMDKAKESLEIKRTVIEELMDKGMYPYSKFYLSSVKERSGKYWSNHFSTIGLVGMNEACLALIGKDVGTDDGRQFAAEVLEAMRKKMEGYQEETGNLYNLEATPAEGTSYRLARIDAVKFPDMVFANGVRPEHPFYTNSTQLPVDYTDDMFDILDRQDRLQSMYTGGTVIHFYLGERVRDIGAVKDCVKKVCESYTLPYFSLTPSFSVCREHGYLDGEKPVCPDCGATCEVYSRVVGYLRPVGQWNDGKAAEFPMRKKVTV